MRQPQTLHPLPRPALAPGVGRRARRTLILATLTSLTVLPGCYVQAPLTGVPQPGTPVLLDLNDRGRVALGDSIGPSAARISGLVERGSDSAYVLRVSSVQYLNGQTNQWSGEPLTIRSDLVGRARTREYSRKRTWALGIGAVATVVAFALSQDLFGSGGIGKSTDPPPPVGTQ